MTLGWIDFLLTDGKSSWLDWQQAKEELQAFATRMEIPHDLLVGEIRFFRGTSYLI